MENGRFQVAFQLGGKVSIGFPCLEPRFAIRIGGQSAAGSSAAGQFWRNGPQWLAALLGAGWSERRQCTAALSVGGALRLMRQLIRRIGWRGRRLSPVRWLENEVEVDVRAPIALEEHARLPRGEFRAP